MAKKRREETTWSDFHHPTEHKVPDLVYLHLFANDGHRVDLRLTRVPMIGEEICHEDKSYRVIRVQHFPTDDEGRTSCGWQAFVDVKLHTIDDKPVMRRKFHFPCPNMNRPHFRQYKRQHAPAAL